MRIVIRLYEEGCGMELMLAILCFIAYLYTLDGLCLIAVGLLMIAWEIWYCFHDKKLS
jgi:hypothetical protein